MSIKSDTWIRQMATEHGMIEPFEPDQVKNADGKRLVSYGTSSYGYDMRVADEYKIFTNVRNAIVDPKGISEDAFVSIQADDILIPPNSFALCRSLEKFRIPRNVLCVVLGKSTYARCFRGDTRVALVDGTSVSLEELARRSDEGESFWGYGLSPTGRIVVTLLDEPRFVGRDALLELTLDNGEQIHCTPDHEFPRRDGRMAQAHDLRPGDSLMPLYRMLVRGYESVYQPLNGLLLPTHRLADEWNVEHGIYEDEPGTHRHHKDHDRRNNNPWNLERMPASEHIRHHNAHNYGDEFDPDEHSAAIREALARLRQDPDWRRHYASVQRTRALQFWNDERYAQAREALRAKRRAIWTPELRAQRAAEFRDLFADPDYRAAHAKRMRDAWADDPERRRRQAEVARGIRLRDEITAKTVREALERTGSIRGAARLLNGDRSAFRRFPGVLAAFRGRRQKLPNNHKVVSIRSVPGQHDVYCLTAPETGNFALEAGVFTSNCGMVVNVTPLEPAWEGYVTIEISNTTPLPAKVYSNEGIAQVLFFESDEQCATSYADKGGKYQNQPPKIVLPRLG